MAVSTLELACIFQSVSSCVVLGDGQFKPHLECFIKFRAAIVLVPKMVEVRTNNLRDGYGPPRKSRKTVNLGTVVKVGGLRRKVQLNKNCDFAKKVTLNNR